MNKNFALVLSCAVSILGLASCNTKEADMLKPNDKTHTVVFQAQNPAASETKTSLRLEVVPDWRETNVNDVHIFETETVGETVTTTEATYVSMEIVDDKNALFTADFPNATVIVDPPKTTTKASSSSSYQYTAIMATRDGDKYVVPSVQYPHEVAWIDPRADMLVGRNETIYSHWLDGQELGLDFERPVALARLAITNLEGAKVTMVKITTVNNITGYLTYNDVDFDNKKEQEFLSDDSDKVLTLLYPGEGKKRTTTFYAYFVCVPHGVQFSKIEVYTDQYVFTKEYSTPPTITFTAGDFMNIALDMTPKEGNGVTKTGLGTQTLSFVDGDKKPVTEAEYDLYSADPFVAPTLVIGDNVVDPTKVEVSSDKEEVAIASYASGVVSVSFPGKTGVATITATVPGDETHAAGTASFKLTVVDSTPKTAQEIAFAKEAVDYDLYGGTGTLTLPAWAENKDPKTTVTYASNSEVITVDETSGEVTIGATAKVGDTAVITATAAEDDTYQEATATCTITVVDTTPAPAPGFYKVTSTDGLIVGKKYILVFEGLPGDTDGDADPKVFKPTLSSSTTFNKATSNALAVEITNGMISPDGYNDCLLTLEEGYYLKADAANSYLYPSGTSGGSGTLSAESTASHNLTVSFDEGIAQIKAQSGTNYLVWSISNHYFSSNASVSGQYSTGICLYRLDDERAEQNLQFSAAEAEYDLYTKNWTKAVPSLSGAETTVTYESSNEAVATVNSNGDVTIASTAKKGNTATITATAAATTAYKEGSASYTITIVNSNTQAVTYYKASTLDAGYDYVIVSANKALKNNGSGNVVAEEDVQVQSNTISLEDADDLLWTVANADASLSENGKFTLKNGEQYLYRNGGSGTSTLIASTEPATPKYGVWDYDGTYFFNISTSSYGVSTYYAYYDSGWKITTTQTEADIYTARPAREVSFSASSAEFDIANPSIFVKPTLNGASGATVTYSSSDETVATVASDGTITALKKTSTPITITATVAASNQYQSASASYKLTVVNSSETPSVYNKVTSVADLEAGGQYIIVYEGDPQASKDENKAPKVFNPVLNSDGSQFAKATSSALPVEITNNSITSTEFDNCLFTLQDGYYLKANDANKYIYPGYSGNTSYLYAEGTATASHALTISFDNGLARILNGSRYIVWSTSNYYFSSNTLTSSSAAGICLYMLDDGQPKDRNLAFSASSKSVNVYGKTESYVLTDAPTLSGKAGALDDVTYSVTGDENVASVASDGKVTLLLGTGTVTVKASANKTDKWLAGEASYTLTVTNVAPPTYTRIAGSAELVSGTYVIADKTDAYLFNASGSNNGGYATIGTTTGVTRSETTITLTDDIAAAYEFVFTVSGDNLTIKQVGGTHAGQYMFASTSVSSTYIGFQTAENNFTINPQEVDLVFFRTSKGDSDAEYLYKKSSDSYFKLGKSGKPTDSDGGVYLYKKN